MNEERRKHSRDTPDRRRETSEQVPLIAYAVAVALVTALLLGTLYLVL